MLNAVVARPAEPSVLPTEGNEISLATFVGYFRDDLLHAIMTTSPPVYTQPAPHRDATLAGLKRKPFDVQRTAVQALAALLLDQGERAAVLNGEMGTGKTLMAIALAAVLDAEGIKRHLVISPPHLVYKWRREILDTVPNASVWIFNGPDAIARLLKLRAALKEGMEDRPTFFILGRVRMRMGFHWKPAAARRRVAEKTEALDKNGKIVPCAAVKTFAACPDCGAFVCDEEGLPLLHSDYAPTVQTQCRECKAALWTLMRPGNPSNLDSSVTKMLMELPTIGNKTAARLIGTFGAEFLAAMLGDNQYEFTNLLTSKGEFVFTERQAERIGRALSKMEFALNGGASYQPTEFIKRYLPKDAFGTLFCDEAHELKGMGTAQGVAYGVLAGRIKKVILLTGTLLGGYANDIFSLLFRCMPQRFFEDGFRFNGSGSLGTAEMAFMQQYGVLKTVTKRAEGEAEGYRTSRAKKATSTVSRAPGFSPKGLARYVLPYTVFVKLKDIGKGVLPSYNEIYLDVSMTDEMADAYSVMQNYLVGEMRQALRRGDHTLVGVVMNVLLRWPETCFVEEKVVHPRSRDVLHYQPALFDDGTLTPKEEALVSLVHKEIAEGRRVLVYTTYTDTRDTTARLRSLLARENYKAVVLKSTVPTEKREDWILDQIDAGAQVLICNPELVKTGLDLLEFPTIVFMNTGYNVYTLQQAARRSWRIGQKAAVRVIFIGYAGSAQTTCLKLMGKKIAVSQSTSGEIPESGLEVLNEATESVEIELAKQLLAA